MRKTLSCLLLLVFVYFSKAQQNLPSFNYVPQAPTTAAYTRYGDIPVDLSTGVTAISIPIYTLSENGINVPVSISYHASGIKVADVAGAVGLGWTLNAGGVITRTALGLKDEKLDFYNPTYYRKPPFRNSSQFEDYNGVRDGQNRDVWAEELYYMINNPPNYGRYDFYSDRYYYSLANGESGVFRKDFMTDIFKFMPYRPTKVRFFQVGQESISDLKIEMTTNDGVRYIFKRNLYDLWYPEKIINSSNSDSVVFYSHFEPIRINTYSTSQDFGPYKTEIYLDGTECNTRLSVRENNTPSSIMFQLDMKDDEVVLIDSIVGANSVIRFTYAQDRQDYQQRGIYFANKSRLSNVQVYSKYTGALIKNIDFLHSYVAANKDFRMLLTAIQTGNNGEEKYGFKYNAESLPDYYIPSGPGMSDPMFLQDFWGYNRAGGPASYSTMFSDFAPSGADLYPNEDRAQASILKEIKYPTGGRSVFEYESHRVPTYFYGPGFSSPPADGKVGGLRIKKISSYAYDGAMPHVKTYEYVCDLPADYGQLNANNFTYSQETYNVLPACRGEVGKYATTFKEVCVSNAMGRYIGGPQAPVYYTKVTEYNGDGNKNTGKTVYYYQINQNNYGVPNEPRFTGPWERDLGSYKPPLEKKEEYKYENGQYKLVRKTETEYNDMYTGESFLTGFNVASYLQFYAVESTPDVAFRYYVGFANWYFSTLHYNDVIGLSLHFMPKKTSMYDYIDENNYLLSTTEYTYNQYDLQTSAITTTSKGELLKTKYTYPVDYPTQAPYSTMIERNLITPVIEQSGYKIVSGAERFLQSMKTNYNFWNYTNQSWGNAVTNQILPQNVETKKGTRDAESRIQYYSYDDKGHPMYVAKENDVRQLYLWGYNQAYPIAQVINIPEDQKKYVVYNSFEAVKNWSPSLGTILDDNTAPTGKKCLLLGGAGWLEFALNSNTSYILSYWYKVGGTINVTANSTILATSQPKNGWIYVKRKITGSSVVSIRGISGSFIDEVRLYPEAAQMTTYAYESLVGMTAQCDANDRITYYTYDASGRLSLVKDDNGNILKKICYNYQGQTDVCGENAIPQWRLTGATRCKQCPGNSAYFTKMTQFEERDNNVNSETYGSTRWRDTVGVNCYVPADWQPTGNFRCRTLGGQNTGEQEREWKDMNPCSDTGGNTKWEISGRNITACPLPAVFQSLDVSGMYLRQNCGSQVPKPYYVSMPQGAFSSVIDVQDATNKAKSEAQRLANLNGECITVYVRSVAVLKTDPSADQQYTDHYFYFYADAAGTIPLTLPITLGINYTLHQWWTENGNFAYDSGFDPGVFGAKAGGSYDFYYDLESTFCPHEWCWHQEIIIQPGPYVIIP
jgi:hypothetical protein